ncbi:hypothetical protein HF1_01840 [Mycoplasma haemofelis str. Langford 1]|uniref:Uncharacterized protein n=1 Tax=Mycoplasma haemofelis (strain Langford 1) TaxID=941640 RepID=E8ZKM6_MYCHL|nr:hypothetical protein [Mycoplasma haemofelis]CBY92192.1 hypothetical protein HF1_01840 [Mycoplasma haemofelis str. Langford 1]
MSLLKKVVPVVAAASGIAGLSLVKITKPSEDVLTVTPSETTKVDVVEVKEEVQEPVVEPPKPQIKEIKERIRDKFSSSKKTLITLSSHDNAWEVRKQQYQSKFQRITTKEDIDRWCNQSLDSEYQEPLYKNVLELCTVPTMRDRFTFKKKKIIDQGKGDPRWVKKVTDYRISNRKMPSGELQTQNGAITTEVIYKWCETGIEEEFKDDSDKRYQLVENWCVA